jgi:hypothetical protein
LSWECLCFQAWRPSRNRRIRSRHRSPHRSPHNQNPLCPGDYEYYEPGPGFNRQDRDIDLQVLRAVLAAHYRSGWEFQADALALRAHGTAVLSSTPPNPPPVASNALAIGAGLMARWNILALDRFRFFADGAGDLILNDRPFPPHGSVYDFFLRAGGGVSIRLSDSYWIEASWYDAHISNGQSPTGVSDLDR